MAGGAKSHLFGGFDGKECYSIFQRLTLLFLIAARATVRKWSLVNFRSSSYPVPRVNRSLHV